MECDPVIGPAIDPDMGFVTESAMEPVMAPVIDPGTDMAELLDSGIAAKLPKRPCASFFTPAVK
jgi:hypothetical protein